MRIPIIAGNWKMNTTTDEALLLVEDMLDALDALEGVEIVLCPPFVSLAPVRELLADTHLKLGAQNLFWESKGAFTGEISPVMLEPLCQYVIIGHSERRQYFDETDDVVARKARAALAHHLRPIVCVGENLSQRNAGQAATVVSRQVQAVFGQIPLAQVDDCVIAYEPIWAIGTGVPAHGEDAQTMCETIRQVLSDLYAPGIVNQIRIQYGGSVTGANIAEFISQPDVDGALVGGASLKADDFVRICAITQQHRRVAP